MYHYHAFNLSILSDLCFPELLARGNCALPNHNSIHIQWGEVNPNGLANANPHRGLFYQATESTLWLHIPNVARFLISHGNQIIVDPIAADEDSIRVFILGSCMGALLMQRDLFLLHGNAIKMGEHCVSFVGHSGAGKSTLSGAFFKRGYSILADDVCAIDTDGHVTPSFPQIKLWLDAAKHLTIDTLTLRKVRPNLEKFAVPLAQQFHQAPLPLKIVYVLNTHNTGTFHFTAMTGMQKMQPLQNNTYRRNYVKALSKDHAHFKQCARIATQTSIVRVVRPNHGFQLDNLVDLIEQDLMHRGLHHVY